MATLTAMWEELLGSGPDRKTLLAGKPGRTAQTATWSYPEAEAVIIEEYRRRGLLPRISTRYFFLFRCIIWSAVYCKNNELICVPHWIYFTPNSQEKALDSMKQSFEKQSSFNSEAGSREGSVASDNHGGADAALAALGAIGKEDWEDHLPPKPHKRETPPSSRSSSPIVPRSKSLAESVTVTPTPTPLVPPAEPEEAYTSNIIYVPNIVHANSGIAMQEETLEEGPEEEKMEEEEGDLNFGEVSQEAQVPVDAEELAAPEHKEGDYCADFGEQIVTRSVSQDQETREAYKPPPVLQTDSPEATIESSSGQIPAADSPLPPFKPLYSLPKRSKAPAPEVIKAEQAVAAKGSKISPDKEPSSPPVSAVLSSLVKEGIEATPVKVSPQKAVPTTTSAAVLAKASGGSIADRYLKGLSSPPKEASKEELVKAEMHSSRPMNALPHKANPVLANKGQAARYVNRFLILLYCVLLLILFHVVLCLMQKFSGYCIIWEGGR